ncbi:DciA family protein [Porphyromonadaceae bacterium W3.11]|nr:DciA family protein [Porphyromonadaceae bacterium W3.11]
MRKYTSDHIGKLLGEKRDELDLLSMIKKHQALKMTWDKIPDPRLKKIDIEFMITNEGTLTIQCPSSVLLNYVRRQRSMITNHLSSFMREYEIKNLEIVLGSSSNH